MAFEQRTWTDRDVQYPGKRTITNIDDNSDFQDVIVERAEGTVTTAGDLYCAQVMNDLESRIAQAFSEVTTDLGNEVDSIYPVGSVYQSFSNTSPETLFPGTTWESLDRVMIASNSSGNLVGNTGNTVTYRTQGSITLSGTVAGAYADLPAHYHQYTDSYGVTSTSQYTPTGSGSATVGASNQAENVNTTQTGNGWMHTHPFSVSGTFTGGTQNIDIRQAYITMYAWRRVA